jgi:hypothetical protein
MIARAEHTAIFGSLLPGKRQDTPWPAEMPANMAQLLRFVLGREHPPRLRDQIIEWKWQHADDTAGQPLPPG